MHTTDVETVLTFTAWTLASLLVGVAVAVGTRLCYRLLRYFGVRFEKPEYDLIFVTFTLVGFPVSLVLFEHALDWATKVRIQGPVVVYREPPRRWREPPAETNVVAVLNTNDRVRFLDKGAKTAGHVKIKLRNGQVGYLAPYDDFKLTGGRALF